jgi:SAM-dependent methyltransferase
MTLDVDTLPISPTPCHVCTAQAVVEMPAFAQFHRVTSDCKPWPAGGRLGVCRRCGCVQKVIDADWQQDIERIYAGYTIYHQSGGVEQAVFEQASGQAASRSARLLERVLSHVALPERGRLLDIGCGNGAMLRAFNQMRPTWALAGTEFNDLYRAVVEQIAGVEALYTCSPAEVPGQFQLISMIHVLEHIPSPIAFLTTLHGKLDDDGLLLIEVPDHTQNPFELLIADHSTHFSAASVQMVLEHAGYTVEALATDWIAKEISVVARKAGETRSPPPFEAALRAEPFEAIGRRVAWLQSVVAAARECAAQGEAGLFGTSIAATWLFNELAGQVRFFVDEDPNRAGSRYMDVPIYHPQDVPAGGHVFLALAPALAEAVQQRMQHSNPQAQWHRPPALS